MQEHTDLRSLSLPGTPELQNRPSATISPMMMSPSSFTVSLAASAASISSLERDEFRSIHPWRDRIMWWVLPAKRLLYIFHNFTNSREVDPLLELVK